MKKEIASTFSIGQFRENYNFFADDIEWNIYGENILSGKDAVMSHCEKITQYFQSVKTDFETFSVIENHDKIAINGKAVFRKEEKKIAVIHSCDIYEFNDQEQIQNIKSYCITEKESFNQI